MPKSPIPHREIPGSPGSSKQRGWRDMKKVGEKCPETTLQESLLGLIGESAALDGVREQIRLVAQYDEPVLIVGETGTGKELVARAIHALSCRNTRPLQTVNCGAVADDMLVSELFGHRAGAFTGANGSRAGRVRAADGSTLFLDEISETSRRFQVALLRVIDQGEVQPVGEDDSGQAVNVRFISATNRSQAELEAGEVLRKDLFYRLSSFVIDIPPLRERPEDIQALVPYFTEGLARKYGAHWKFSGPAIALLQEYSFPGNVRELRQVIFAACVSSNCDTISAAHVRRGLGRFRNENGKAAGTEHDFALQPLLHRHLKEAILVAECNLSKAARMLRVPRSTLQYMLVRHGIDLSRVREEALVAADVVRN